VTPLHFEQTYQAEWAELEALIDRTLGRKIINESADRAEGKVPDRAAVRAARAAGRNSRDDRRATAARDRVRLAALYRRACEQLALARARAYPAYIVDRLERVTAAAHQLIYHRREFRFAQLRDLALIAFPRSVRAHWRYVAVSAAAFLLPTIVVGVLVYARPDFILSVLSQDMAAQFEQMYSPDAEAIGRRTASTDWMMFGYYIRNNVGVSFQCFAGGLFAGVGSLFFLGYNGAFGGAIAGYLTERGLSSTFYSFIATHSSFELTAIILSGAAGLRIGHALLAPGRWTRRQALVTATTDTSVLLYGVTVMLIVAAAIEAFWSSARWLPLPVKYSVAAVCWIAVITFFVRQGRHAD
jgi:uncharacterized membrane protein SpoIIM required for sporulation